MKMKTAVPSILLLFVGPVLLGQSPPTDPLAESLFPPELVLQHQAEIGLTDEQRTALMSQVQKAQDRFNDLQQRLQKEMEDLGGLLKNERSEEQSVLTQFDKVLDREREL